MAKGSKYTVQISTSAGTHALAFRLADRLSMRKGQLNALAFSMGVQALARATGGKQKEMAMIAAVLRDAGMSLPKGESCP